MADFSFHEFSSQQHMKYVLNLAISKPSSHLSRTAELPSFTESYTVFHAQRITKIDERTPEKQEAETLFPLPNHLPPASCTWGQGARSPYSCPTSPSVRKIHGENCRWTTAERTADLSHQQPGPKGGKAQAHSRGEQRIRYDTRQYPNSARHETQCWSAASQCRYPRHQQRNVLANSTHWIQPFLKIDLNQLHYVPSSFQILTSNGCTKNMQQDSFSCVRLLNGSKFN